MSLRIPARHPALTPQWVKNELWRRARAIPSLDLRFAENKSLVDATTGQNLVTFTRASSGTYVDSQGVIRTATTNEARFDHNPTTGESLGLLVEEQRTNSIRNNTMVGAVAGTPGTLPTNYTISGLGTLSQQVVGVGTTGGISYFDLRLSGTTSTTQASVRLETSNGAAGANGQTFTFSCWLARIAGSLANITGVLCNANIYDAATVYLATTGFIGFDSTAQPTSLVRRSGTLTIAQAASAFIQPQIVLTFNSGVAIDITLRIGMPQLEQGAFATSVIPTSGTAATRSADVASITGSNFSSWYRQGEGTVFAESLAPSVNTTILGFSDGTANERILMDVGTNTKRLIVSDNNVLQALITRQYTYGTMTKSVAGLKIDSCQFADSGSPGTEGTTATLPTVDRLNIGSNATGVLLLNGTIRRLTYWPRRLPNETLQAITQ